MFFSQFWNLIKFVIKFFYKICFIFIKNLYSISISLFLYINLLSNNYFLIIIKYIINLFLFLFITIPLYIYNELIIKYLKKYFILYNSFSKNNFFKCNLHKFVNVISLSSSTLFFYFLKIFLFFKNIFIYFNKKIFINFFLKNLFKNKLLFMTLFLKIRNLIIKCFFIFFFIKYYFFFFNTIFFKNNDFFIILDLSSVFGLLKFFFSLMNFDNLFLAMYIIFIKLGILNFVYPTSPVDGGIFLFSAS